MYVCVVPWKCVYGKLEEMWEEMWVRRKDAAARDNARINQEQQKGKMEKIKLRDSEIARLLKAISNKLQCAAHVLCLSIPLCV